MKKIAHLTLSLTLIAAVCAAVLAAVNAATQDAIATIKVQAKRDAAKGVMPQSVTAVEEAADGTFIGKDAQGAAVAYAVTGRDGGGYGGDIVLMVGFTPDLHIVTYRKLEASETPGLGTNLASPDFMKQFAGLDARADLDVKKDGGAVEAITSATITSRAVCRAINAARARLQTHLAAAR